MSCPFSFTDSDEDMSTTESHSAPVATMTAPAIPTTPARNERKPYPRDKVSVAKRVAEKKAKAERESINPSTKKKRKPYPRDKASREIREAEKKARLAREEINPPVRKRLSYDRRPAAMAERAAKKKERQTQMSSDVLTPTHGPINNVSNTHISPPQIAAQSSFSVNNNNSFIPPPILNENQSFTSPTMSYRRIQQLQPTGQMGPNTPLPALTREEFRMHEAYANQQLAQQHQVAAQQALYQQVVNEYIAVTGDHPAPISEGMSLQVYISNLRSVIACHRWPVHTDSAVNGYYAGFGGQQPLPTYDYPAVANNPAAHDIASGPSFSQDTGALTLAGRSTLLFATHDYPPYHTGGVQATGARFQQAPPTNPTPASIPPPVAEPISVMADRLLERIPVMYDRNTTQGKVTALTFNTSPAKARHLITYGMDRVHQQSLSFPLAADIADQGLSTLYAFTGYTQPLQPLPNSLPATYTILCWKDGLDQSETWSLTQHDPTEVMQRLARAQNPTIKMGLQHDLQGSKTEEGFWVFFGGVECYVEALRALAKKGDVAAVKAAGKGLSGRLVGTVGREVPVPPYRVAVGDEVLEERTEWGEIGGWEIQWMNEVGSKMEF